MFAFGLALYLVVVLFTLTTINKNDSVKTNSWNTQEYLLLAISI